MSSAHHLPLDRIDLKILHCLQEDGRISNLKLAEAVALSPTAVLARVQRLSKEGYILGYEARLNPLKLGALEDAVSRRATVPCGDRANVTLCVSRSRRKSGNYNQPVLSLRACVAARHDTVRRTGGESKYCRMVSARSSALTGRATRSARPRRFSIRDIHW